MARDNLDTTGYALSHLLKISRIGLHDPHECLTTPSKPSHLFYGAQVVEHFGEYSFPTACFRFCLSSSPAPIHLGFLDLKLEVRGMWREGSKFPYHHSQLVNLPSYEKLLIRSPATASAAVLTTFRVWA